MTDINLNSCNIAPAQDSAIIALMLQISRCRFSVRLHHWESVKPVQSLLGLRLCPNGIMLYDIARQDRSSQFVCSLATFSTEPI